MAGFKLAAFRGERPSVSSRLLEPTEAQLAQNVKLGSGELRPLHDVVQAATLARSGTNTTIYSFGSGTNQRWLHWNGDVDVARGPVADDTTERTYYTGDGEPRLTNSSLVDVGGNDAYPESYYKLGVPAPTLACTASISTVHSQGRVTEPMTAPALQARFMTVPVITSPYKSAIESTDGSAKTVEFVLPVGTDLTVTRVDEDTVKLAPTNGDPGFALTNPLSGWKISEASAAPDQPANVQLRIPAGITVTIEDHGLRTGDVITVTSVEVPLTWTTTPSLNIDFTELNNCTPTVGGLSVSGIWTYSVRSRAVAQEVLVRSYVYTWVTTLGEESAPSPPSNEVEYATGDAITLESFSTPPSDHIVITKARIYRSSTGTENTEFQFVKEVDVPLTTVEDDVPNEELGEILQTETWDPPPSGLKGLVALPNGVFAGFVGNTVYLSEPGYPHAWPQDYKQAVDYPVVALCPFGTSLLVATEGVPYVGQGAHPRNFSLRRIEFDQACVSKRSAKNIGEAAIYASPDGLVAVSNSAVRLVTEGLIDRDEWQTYNPSSIHAYAYNGLYIAFYSGGTKGSGTLIFDPFNANVGLSHSDRHFVGAFVDKKSDTLFVTDGSKVSKWDQGTSKLTMLWRSKLFELESPNNFGFLRVVAESYPVTVRVYGDEVLRDTLTVSDSSPVRLSSGRLYDTYYLEIEGTSVVKKVLIGDDAQEVMEG